MYTNLLKSDTAAETVRTTFSEEHNRMHGSIFEGTHSSLLPGVWWEDPEDRSPLLKTIVSFLMEFQSS